MKKIEAVVEPVKLNGIKEALAKDGFWGMKIVEAVVRIRVGKCS